MDSELNYDQPSGNPMIEEITRLLLEKHPLIPQHKARELAYVIYAQKMEQILEQKKSASDLELEFPNLVVLEDLPAETKDFHFRVNLPSTQIDYENGNGEGCWAVPLTVEDHVKNQANVAGTTFQFVLDNDSVYYPLDAYSVLEAEVRGGDLRPVLNVPKYKKQKN